MPSYIVKVARDRDEYVWWSDITEMPVAVGTRAEVEQALAAWARHDEEREPDRFDRADANGCSAMWPRVTQPVYGWDSTGPIAEQRGIVPRDRIGEYARLRIADDPGAFDILEPLEDDE